MTRVLEPYDFQAMLFFDSYELCGVEWLALMATREVCFCRHGYSQGAHHLVYKLFFEGS